MTTQLFTAGIKEKRYWTVKETAEFLAVDIKTIYRAIAAGELPARRVGRALRVPRSVVVTDGRVM